MAVLVLLLGTGTARSGASPSPSHVLADWEQVPTADTVAQTKPFSYAVFTMVPAPAAAYLLIPALALLGGRGRQRTT